MHKENKVVFDVSSLAHRYYHGSGDANTVPDAFFSFVTSIQQAYKGYGITMAFDSDSSESWRLKIFPDYKKDREEKPEALVQVLRLIYNQAIARNFDILFKKGFEADDLIGGLAQEQKALGFSLAAITSDKDIFQIIDDEADIFVYDPIKRIEIRSQDVVERFGIYPTQMKDYLSMVGDTSDNVPGCPGIGKVTAVELLRRLDNLAGIFAEIKNPDTEMKPAIKAKLEAGLDSIRMSWRLISLVPPKVEPTVEMPVEALVETQVTPVEVALVEIAPVESNPIKVAPEQAEVSLQNAMLYVLQAGQGYDIETVYIQNDSVVIRAKGFNCPIYFDFISIIKGCQNAVHWRHRDLCLVNGLSNDQKGICFIVKINNDICQDINVEISNGKLNSSIPNAVEYLDLQFYGANEVEATIKAAYHALKYGFTKGNDTDVENHLHGEEGQKGD